MKPCSEPPLIITSPLWFPCLQDLEETRKSLISEQAAQLAHIESMRQSAGVERSATAKKYQVSVVQGGVGLGAGPTPKSCFGC